LPGQAGLGADGLPALHDPAGWPALRERFSALFRTRTRSQWCELLEGSDACFAPVLTMTEARAHPHARARGAFVEVEGVAQPRPAPRFSRTDSSIQGPPGAPGANTDGVLGEGGFAAAASAGPRGARAA